MGIELVERRMMVPAAARAVEDVLQGSGELDTQIRTLSRYTSIYVDGLIHVVVTFAEERHLSVCADDNLLEAIDTRVENRILHVRLREPFQTANPVTVQLSMDLLTSVRAVGGSVVDIRHPESDRLDVHLQGEGDVRAFGDGRIGHLEAVVKGSGAIRMGPVVVRSATLTVHGTGRIEAKVRERVTAAVLGSGQIRVMGNPATRKTDLKGSGKITFG